MNEKIIYAVLAICMSAMSFVGARFMTSADQAMIMRDDASEVDYELRLRREWMATIDDLAKALEKDVERNSDMIAMVRVDVANIRNDTAHIPVLLTKIEMMEKLLMRDKQAAQLKNDIDLSMKTPRNHRVTLEDG